MVKQYNAPAYAVEDTTGFDVTPSNSSRPVNARVKTVNFDKDSSFYDMSGHKYMIILNQHIFQNTKHFKWHPKTRNGTMQDESRLRKLFAKLGFSLFVKRDHCYKKIINFLRAFAASDHTTTSCICVTILTHGDTGGQIYAADRPYFLNEVMAIFLNEKSLTNKPKLFIVQACRGDFMDPGHTVCLRSQIDSMHQESQCDSALSRPNYFSSETPVYYSASEEKVYMNPTGRGRADAPFCSCCLFDLFKACRDFWMYAGNTDATVFDSQNFTNLTVPIHADTLVLRSTVENYLSWRDGNGSWMIQALCDIMGEHYKDLNLYEMIIKMNRTVAYDKITTNCKYRVMNYKKQIPETSFTLTKHLKFETVPSKAQCSISNEEATMNDEP